MRDNNLIHLLLLKLRELSFEGRTISIPNDKAIKLAGIPLMRLKIVSLS
jgi:hypothetical protein